MNSDRYSDERVAVLEDECAALQLKVDELERLLSTANDRVSSLTCDVEFYKERIGELFSYGT